MKTGGSIDEKPPTLWGTDGGKPKDLGDLVEKTSWPMLRRKNREVGENREV